MYSHNHISCADLDLLITKLELNLQPKNLDNSFLTFNTTYFFTLCSRFWKNISEKSLVLHKFNGIPLFFFLSPSFLSLLIVTYDNDNLGNFEERGMMISDNSFCFKTHIVN